MTTAAQLIGLPSDIHLMAQAKRARLSRTGGISKIERALREKDIAALFLMERIAMAIKGDQEGFRVWYRMVTGAPL